VLIFDGKNGKKPLFYMSNGLFKYRKQFSRQHQPNPQKSGISPEADVKRTVNIAA
jgi:hypothetical protein